MSAEPDLNEDFRLPEELGVVEAALRGFSPTSGNLNRDDLMYQSGWAAAKAKAAAPNGAIRVWQAATGLLAAALLISLALPRGNESPMVVESTSQQIAPVQESAPRNASAEEQSRRIIVTRRIRSTAPMLVMRDRALRFEFDELPTSSSADDGLVEISTNRNLLEEFLPAVPSQQRSMNKQRSWWSYFRSGEAA